MSSPSFLNQGVKIVNGGPMPAAQPLGPITAAMQELLRNGTPPPLILVPQAPILPRDPRPVGQRTGPVSAMFRDE
jgi:hypothetical protein